MRSVPQLRLFTSRSFFQVTPFAIFFRGCEVAHRLEQVSKFCRGGEAAVQHDAGHVRAPDKLVQEGIECAIPPMSNRIFRFLAVDASIAEPAKIADQVRTEL